LHDSWIEDDETTLQTGETRSSRQRMTMIGSRQKKKRMMTMMSSRRRRTTRGAPRSG